MKNFAGTLVFILVVAVNDIVCPGRRLDFKPKVQLHPSEFTEDVIEPADYPGAHIKVGGNGSLELVTGPLGVYKKGNIIVARNWENRPVPIYNSAGQVTIRDTASRTTELLTVLRARELGLLPHLTERAEAYARQNRS